MYDNLVAVGGIEYTPREREFAEILRQSLTDPPPIESAGQIEPYRFTRRSSSTDVGDVSWVVPTAALRTANGCRERRPTHGKQSLRAE